MINLIIGRTQVVSQRLRSFLYKSCQQRHWSTKYELLTSFGSITKQLTLEWAEPWLLLFLFRIILSSMSEVCMRQTVFLKQVLNCDLTPFHVNCWRFVLSQSVVEFLEWLSKFNSPSWSLIQLKLACFSFEKCPLPRSDLFSLASEAILSTYDVTFCRLLRYPGCRFIRAAAG